MKTVIEGSFEDRVAAVLDRMANQVHEPPGGPPPGLLSRAYRRMSIVAVGTALFASAVGVAGSLLFGSLSGDGPSILPHAHGSSQLAIGGVGLGDQRSEDHGAFTVLPADAPGIGWVLTSVPVPHHPRYQPPPAGSGVGTAAPIIVRAGGGIGGQGKGWHRHHHHRGGRHHRHHRGGGRHRMR